MSDRAPMEVLVEPAPEGGFLVRAPAVGVYGHTPRVGEILTAGSRVGRDAPRRDEGPTRRLEPTEPLSPEAVDDASDIRVYRQQPPKRRWGRVHPKVVAVTALLAFVIAGVVVTAGQVAIGNPFGDDGNGAIILGQGKKKSK